MKTILPAIILSMISAVAVAQSTVQKEKQKEVQQKPAVTAQAVSSVGALAGAGGGAAAASYAATGKVIAPVPNSSNITDSTKNAAERRRVEVLKSNKTDDPNAITVNPLYTPSGNSGVNPLFKSSSRSINESGVSVKSDSKPKKHK